MVTLRCTAKLRRRLGLGVLSEPGPSDSVLGDWYANLLVLERQPLVLCVSEHSLLAVVLHARDLRHLAMHFRQGLESRLLRLGISTVAVGAELERSGNLAFGATCSRSVLGSMTDFVFQLQARAAYHPGEAWTVAELEDDLATIPCAPLQYRRPRPDGPAGPEALAARADGRTAGRLDGAAAAAPAAEASALQAVDQDYFEDKE